MSKTREILFRRVFYSDPAGIQSNRVERIEVEIDWLGERPPSATPPYEGADSWTISEHAWRKSGE